MSKRPINWKREVLLALLGLLIGSAIGYVITPPQPEFSEKKIRKPSWMVVKP